MADADAQPVERMDAPLDTAAVALSAFSLFGGVVRPSRTPLTPEAARWFLAQDFSEADRKRHDHLTARSRAGHLTEEEEQETSAFLDVADLLSLMQCRARVTLGLSYPSGPDSAESDHAA